MRLRVSDRRVIVGELLSGISESRADKLEAVLRSDSTARSATRTWAQRLGEILGAGLAPAGRSASSRVYTRRDQAMRLRQSTNAEHLNEALTPTRGHGSGGVWSRWI